MSYPHLALLKALKAGQHAHCLILLAFSKHASASNLQKDEKCTRLNCGMIGNEFCASNVFVGIAHSSAVPSRRIVSAGLLLWHSELEQKFFAPLGWSCISVKQDDRRI